MPKFILPQRKQLYNAITFFHYSLNREPMKHRGINNLQKFIEYAKTQNALYINFYYKDNREFSHRVWLNN